MSENNTNSFIAPLMFKILFLIGFAVLATRLFELQVIKGAYFQNLAENNRIRRFSFEGKRGEIHARGGELIAGNKKVLERLEYTKQKGFELVKADGLKEGSPDTYAVWERDYSLGSSFGHLSGYLGQVLEDELGKIDADCPDHGIYKSSDLIGRTGLEEYYNCKLRGDNGEDLFEIDAGGNIVRRLGRKESRDGENIVSNIDYGLQKEVASAMSGKNGAVVVNDLNGEVLAIYSSPSFDPDIILNGTSEQIQSLFNDKNKPFFNRAIGGSYHPGSIFKPLVAIAALEEQVIDKDFKYTDTGKITVKTPFGDFNYSNWYLTQYGGVEGEINLVKAIARSTDTFFYKVGELLGVDQIASWSKKFGLDSNTGIDLPGEITGLVPTPEWKKEERGENWFLGNTYHYSIGQGDLSVTPVGINTAISSITLGRLCPPRVVGSAKCTDLNIKKENRLQVLYGMKAACEPGGTANVFFDFGVPVACKTGTAETGAGDETHAWFTVIAPYPEKIDDVAQIDPNTVVLTVLVERGGEGSKEAAPIAKDILSYWFNKDKTITVDQQ